MKRYTLPIIVLVIIGVLSGLFALWTTAEAPEMSPATFAECAARYPVMESYPRQCMTPDGRTFTEELAEEPVTHEEEPANVAGIDDLIEIESPVMGETVSSPLTITGTARGYWYFEASFPIEIRDSVGVIIANGYAEAQSDWMTESFVPFVATIAFPAQASGTTGTLILRKDNPSGDPSRDQHVAIPIAF